MMARSAGKRLERATAKTRGAAPRLQARVLEILARQIADGTVAPGSVLYESRAAAQFGISRAPVRHALEQLAAAGAIRHAAGRGYVVIDAAALPKSGRAPSAPMVLNSAASWERIYKEVETEIVVRSAFCAWRVVESDLARYHGVSRTVARDVLVRLQRFGVVKKDGKSRWYAPGLSRAYIAELYEMRRVLEPAALAAAAPHLPHERIRSLRANLEDATARADRLDGPALDRLETELHVELLSYCPNRTMIDALHGYRSLLIAHSFLYQSGPQLYALEPFLPEHLEVAARLEAGHVGEAAQALARHLRLSLDRAAARLDIVSRGRRPSKIPYLDPLGDGEV